MPMQNTRRYVRTETINSTVGSTVVGTAIFIAVFGAFVPVPARGIGAYAFDFLPQGFMTALICTLAAGGLTRARIRKGVISRVPGRLPRISSLWLRGLAYGMGGLVFGALPISAAILASGAETIDWTIAVLGKVAFGAAVALIVTPLALHASLREGPSGAMG